MLHYTDPPDTSPTRAILATFLPAVLAYRGLKKQSLDISGAILGNLTFSTFIVLEKLAGLRNSNN